MFDVLPTTPPHSPKEAHGFALLETDAALEQKARRQDRCLLRDLAEFAQIRRMPLINDQIGLQKTLDRNRRGRGAP